MAVLVEAISVIVKGTAIEDRFPGGFEAFRDDVPNATLCADGDIARVGFMTPDDVGEYIEYLESAGLQFLVDGEAVDFVVADQQRGFTTACNWAEVGRTSIDGDAQHIITACQAVDTKTEELICPLGWQYEGSLSQTYTFVPTEHVERSAELLRDEDGLEVYRSALTGNEMYVGRTSTKHGK
ncbi:MAG: hypothetical protein KJO31_13175 [Gammaproteobacteria bacterium]|nr:hypothetical protein [Gammaproteobacteria bacterium]